MIFSLSSLPMGRSYSGKTPTDVSGKVPADFTGAVSQMQNVVLLKQKARILQNKVSLVAQ